MHIRWLIADCPPMETRVFGCGQVPSDRMRSLLENEVISSRDVMFLPEYTVGLLTENTTAYEFRLNEEQYPIEKIYETASLSGFRDKEFAKKQIGLLADHNNVVRYWAITGLRSQSSEALKLHSREIIRAMHDDYPPVVIIASAIAFQEFGDKQAEENLKKICCRCQRGSGFDGYQLPVIYIGQGSVRGNNPIGSSQGGQFI